MAHRSRWSALYGTFALIALATAPIVAASEPPGDSEETLREQALARDAGAPARLGFAAPEELAAATVPSLPAPFPLFVGVDDTVNDTLRMDVTNSLTAKTFDGYNVWGAAFDSRYDHVYFNDGATVYRWTVDGPIVLKGNIDYLGSDLSVVGLALHDGVLYASRNIANEAIYAIDLDTGFATIAVDYADADYDFGGIAIDPRTGDLYGTNDDADPHGVGLYRIGWDGTITLVAAYPGGQTDIDGLAIGRGLAYLVTDEPGSFYVYDLDAAAWQAPLTSPWLAGNLFAGATYIDNLLFGCGFEVYPPDWSAVAPATCSGHCGTGVAGCYCDVGCLFFADCCLDACSTCGFCP